MTQRTSCALGASPIGRDRGTAKRAGVPARATASIPALAFLVLLLAAQPGAAQAPDLLSYQGLLLQPNGVAVVDGTYKLRFELFTQEAGGTLEFGQNLSVNIANGLYNVILSNQGVYDLSAILAANATLYMQVSIVEDGSGTPFVPPIEMSPRQQLASVPYALSVATAPSMPMPKGTYDTATVPLGLNLLTTTAGWVDLGVTVTVTPGTDSNYAVEVNTDVQIHNQGATGTAVLRLVEDVGGNVTHVRGASIGLPTGGYTGVIPFHYVNSTPNPGVPYTYRIEGKANSGGAFNVGRNFTPTGLPTEAGYLSAKTVPIP